MLVLVQVTVYWKRIKTPYSDFEQWRIGKLYEPVSLVPTACSRNERANKWSVPLSRDQALVLFLLGETQSVVYIRLHSASPLTELKSASRNQYRRAVFAYFATNGTATKTLSF